jgi:hypothetical protein
MNMPMVLAFGHRARTGKDEACRTILQQRHGKPIMTDDPSIVYDIKHYSFAKALKQEVTAMALKSGGMQNLFSEGLRYPGAGYYRADGEIIQLPDWVQYDVEDAGDPDCPLGKSRTFLQFWGVFRRQENENHWVKKVEEQIIKDQPDAALVSDCRFPNEMSWARQYGECVRVDRPSVKSPNAHISEEALANVPDDQWSAIIKNTGSLEDFQNEVLFVFDSLMSAVPVSRVAVSTPSVN